MTEKKKYYLTPQMKVVKVQNAQIICVSQPFKSSYESYEEVDASEEGWY